MKQTAKDQEKHSVRLALSVAQAAFEAGVGRDQIYKAIKIGALVAKKCGRRTIILRPDFEAFLASLPNAQLGTSGCQR